jgi:ribosomal protein S8E
VTGSVKAGEEEHANVRQHPLIRQRLALRVPDAQQMRADAAIVIGRSACVASRPGMKLCLQAVDEGCTWVEGRV